MKERMKKSNHRNVEKAKLDEEEFKLERRKTTQKRSSPMTLEKSDIEAEGARTSREIHGSANSLIVHDESPTGDNDKPVRRSFSKP